MTRKKHSKEKFSRLWILITGCLLVVLVCGFSALHPVAASDEDGVESRKAFAEAAQVLFHPRCLNCHPAGDGPTIRDDLQKHFFNVKRGSAGKGVDPLKCAMCHQEANQPDGPPGVPNWHMPPENMPMVFQGRTPGELCRQLKDPLHNGGKTGKQIIDHIESDPLVLWAWKPGPGRTAPTMSHEAFSAKMHLWLEKGLACPE